MSNFGVSVQVSPALSNEITPQLGVMIGRLRRREEGGRYVVS